MRVPDEVIEKFYRGERSGVVRFVINDSVDIIDGPYIRRSGSVISVTLIKPEVVFLVEPGDPPYGDIRVPQSCLRLFE